MKKIFAANWKLNKSPKEARAFMGQLINNQSSFTGEVVIFPSAISLESVATASAASTVKVGLQNAYIKGSGAFTGENSAEVAKELGATYVLIGHSERRSIFGETNELLAEKLAYVQSLDLVPMFCVGETLEERESNQTKSVLKAQLQQGLSKSNKEKPIVIAYEPVWAIGTGRVATETQVAETHTDISLMLKDLGFGGTPILYGGSVKPESATTLIAQPHVSGFLVGGAALEVESFAKIASV